MFEKVPQPPKKKIPEKAKLVFKGIRFDIYHWEETMFDGSIGIFEGIHHSNGGSAIAVVGDRILINIETQPDLPMFKTVPGGDLDEGEDVLLGVKRELLEETGYTSDDFSLLMVNTLAPTGRIDWDHYVFIARNCRKVEEPKLDIGEKITTTLVTFDEFLNLAYDPLFRNKDLILFLREVGASLEAKEEFRKKLFG